MLVYDPLAKISRHFYMKDVAKSSNAVRNSIDNTPPSAVLEAATELAVRVLDPIVDHFAVPFIPISWYRCEQLERFINWKAHETWAIRKGYPKGTEETWKEYFALKEHPLGRAVDIEVPGVNPNVLFRWIKVNIPEYNHLILEYPKVSDPTSGFVHVSYFKNNNRNYAYTIG